MRIAGKKRILWRNCEMKIIRVYWEVCNFRGFKRICVLELFYKSTRKMGAFRYELRESV